MIHFNCATIQELFALAAQDGRLCAEEQHEARIIGQSLQAHGLECTRIRADREDWVASGHARSTFDVESRPQQGIGAQHWSGNSPTGKTYGVFGGEFIFTVGESPAAGTHLSIQRRPKRSNKRLEERRLT